MKTILVWLILWADGTASYWRVSEWTAAQVLALTNVTDAGVVEVDEAAFVAHVG